MNSIQELFDSLKDLTGWDEATLTALNESINEGGKVKEETAEALTKGLQALTTQDRVFSDITSGKIQDREVLKPIAQFFTGSTLSGIEKNISQAFLDNLGDYLDQDKAGEILKGEGKTSEKVGKLVEMAKQGVTTKLARIATSDNTEWEKRWKAAQDQVKALEASVKAAQAEKEAEIQKLQESFISRYRNKAISEQVAKHTANLITKPEVVAKLVKADLPTAFKIEYNAENEGWNVFDKDGKASDLETAISSSLESLGLLRANDKGKNGGPGPQKQTPERGKAPTTLAERNALLAQQKLEKLRGVSSDN